MIDRNRKILAFARAIEHTFTTSEWTEIGYITGSNEWIDGHPRLLRSLRFGDADYKEHVFTAVAYILDVSPENFTQLLQYEQIATWLKENENNSYVALTEEAFGHNALGIEPALSTESGFEALADAHTLLRERSAVSAIDRVHTGLHAFLRAACREASLDISEDTTANQLLKLLLDHHPQLDNLGPRGNDIRRMIRTSASIVDAMGTLRNQASLAHPNEDVLGQEEALFAINLTRSLLRFLDAKLSSR